MRLILNIEIQMDAGPGLQVRDEKDLLALSLHRLSEDVQGGVEMTNIWSSPSTRMNSFASTYASKIDAFNVTYHFYWFLLLRPRFSLKLREVSKELKHFGYASCASIMSLLISLWWDFLLKSYQGKCAHWCHVLPLLGVIIYLWGSNFSFSVWRISRR